MYDDASSASGLGYTFAEISAAFPADFISNGTNKPSYRASVTLQVGDTTTNAATTTLVDTVESTVIWDNTRTLAYRATQTTSWFTNLGTKVGTGDQASGHKGTTLVFGTATTMRGTMNLYGCTIKMQGNFLATLIPTPNAGELVNCLFQSSSASAALSSFSIGSTSNFDNIYNVDITGNVTADISLGPGANTVERCTVGGSGQRGCIQLAPGTSRTYKDIALFGTPTRADMLWPSSTIVNHHLVRPVWTNNAPKFGFVGSAALPSLANATLEYWPYNVKIVDGTGAAISGIPVRLTDAHGNVQVDTTTGSDGRLSYGSGLTEDAVIVMDHYSDTTQYVQRFRGPFLSEINTGPNADNRYRSRTYPFTWPGVETVTTSTGTFLPVMDVIPLFQNEFITVDDLPIEAEHVQRIAATVP